MSICGNMVGGVSSIGKTFVITDENGNELTGVVTENEVIFTATDNDVREGSVYAGDAGVSTGTKVIPSYNTHEGYKIIMPGKPLTIAGEHYDYTKLQALVCMFNTNLSDSISTEKVVINDNIYAVQSTVSMATVIKNNEDRLIDFGILNDSNQPQIVRYFYFKEIY